MTEEELKEYISSVKWRFAKTMPKIPHEYTIKDWNPDKERFFIGFVKHIQKFGEDATFYSKKYWYLIVDNYKYWTMGEPADKTTVVNREKLTRPL